MQLSPKKLFRASEIKVTYNPVIPKQERYTIANSSDVYDLVINEIYSPDAIEYVEIFYILLLNKSGEVLGYKLVSIGGVDGTVVDPKVVFSTALKCHAPRIVLIHNHPSGSLFPSVPDKSLTKKLRAGGEILGIEVLDHLIVSAEGYYSFADEGML